MSFIATLSSNCGIISVSNVLLSFDLTLKTNCHSCLVCVAHSLTLCESGTISKGWRNAVCVRKHTEFMLKSSTTTLSCSARATPNETAQTRGRASKQPTLKAGFWSRVTAAWILVKQEVEAWSGGGGWLTESVLLVKVVIVFLGFVFRLDGGIVIRQG